MPLRPVAEGIALLYFSIIPVNRLFAVDSVDASLERRPTRAPRRSDIAVRPGRMGPDGPDITKKKHVLDTGESSNDNQSPKGGEP